MPEFSTTTQALLDAVCSSTESDCDTQHLIAAAIEALANQVVPEEPDGGMAPRWIRQSVRRQILAIAAELRGEDQPSSDVR